MGSRSGQKPTEHCVIYIHYVSHQWVFFVSESGAKDVINVVLLVPVEGFSCSFCSHLF